MRWQVAEGRGSLVVRALGLAIATLLIAAASAGVFDFFESRRYPSPVASVRSLDLGPAPEPFARPEPPPAQFVEPPTPEAAVTLFLEAEAANRYELSYALLDERSRRDYPVLEAWVTDQADRPRPLRLGNATALAPAGSDTARVEVRIEVAREPALDPFVGFVPAQATEEWRARLADGKWRVQDRPSGVDPELPPESQAAGVARDWLKQAVACADTSGLQVEPELYGLPNLAAALCDLDSVPTAGAVEEFDASTDSSSALAAFGPGIDVWARVVEVAAPRPFQLTLAPLGADWRVLAILPTDAEVRP